MVKGLHCKRESAKSNCRLSDEQMLLQLAMPDSSLPPPKNSIPKTLSTKELYMIQREKLHLEKTSAS